MHFVILAAVLLVSACASGATGNFRGREAGSVGTVVDKYADFDVHSTQSGPTQCRSDQVLWCTVRFRRSACSCRLKRDVSIRAEKLFGKPLRSNQR